MTYSLFIWLRGPHLLYLPPVVQIFLKSDVKYPSAAVSLGHLDKYLSRDQIVREPHLKSHFRGLNQLSGITPKHKIFQFIDDES